MTDGIVNDRWDGSVRLRIELDLAATGKAPPANVLQALADRLFRKGDTGGSLAASANLVVGGRIFPFRSLTVISSSAWVGIGNSGDPAGTDPKAVDRATIDLVLDLAQRANR